MVLSCFKTYIGSEIQTSQFSLMTLAMKRLTSPLCTFNSCTCGIFWCILIIAGSLEKIAAQTKIDKDMMVNLAF